MFSPLVSMLFSSGAAACFAAQVRWFLLNVYFDTAVLVVSMGYILVMQTF